jgi:hypothetical protein
MTHISDRRFLECDQNPDDVALWEALLKDLTRNGYNGPLARIVKHRVHSFGRKAVEKKAEKGNPGKGGNFLPVGHACKS